jgi:transcriptional regulator with XRE-family HTH domain
MADLSKEAREFVDLINAAGWSQSEAGRQLMVTPSFINQIVNGTAQPSRAVLQLLKLTIAANHPELIKAPRQLGEIELREQFHRPDWEENILGQLRPLSEDERSKVVDVMEAALKLVPKRGRPKSISKAA